NWIERCAANRYTGKAAHRLLAEVRQRLGDRTAAEQALHQAADGPEDALWPDPFYDEVQSLRVGKEGSLARTNQLQGEGRLKEAQALHQRMRQQYPEFRWLEEGQVLLERKEYPAAEKALREATRLAPTSVEAHFYWGLALQRQKDYAAATTAFRRVT